MQLAKDMAGAAMQSARQYMSTREALRKARLEERKIREQEARRKEKEEKQRKAQEDKKAARLAAKLKKEEEKQAKKEQERLAREAAEGNGEVVQKDSKKEKQRRLGKGREELGEGDPQVLVTRLRCHEIQTKDDPNSFFKEMSFGCPCIWRARRAPLKRVLQASPDFVSEKDAAAASTMLNTEYKSWLSEFVQKCEDQPEKVRSTKKASEDAQKAREALSLELDLAELCEQQMQPSTADPMVNPYFTVLERALVQERLSAIVKRLKDSAAAGPAVKAVEVESMTWAGLQLVAQQKGKSFSGTMNGMYPHILYQMEGTRAIALVSILDAPCHTC